MESLGLWLFADCELQACVHLVSIEAAGDSSNYDAF